ncbi:hypothetical protein I4U23_002131 [Adineta vaga]|nr:hypothetical protein I4U23_002131 [Adineta vaga]
MLYIIGLILFLLRINVHSLSWNTTEDILPWESYLQLGDIQRPLGLTLNSSSIAHHHFYIGYLCLHSFLYDEARDAFDLAINKTPTLIEAYIGKMLGCKHALWSYTDRTCGQSVYRAAQTMLNISNITLSSLQSSLLSTAYLWYTNQTNTTVGEVTFLSSIGNLSLMYPNETDIRVLWGLSLLNVADQARFQSQMEPAYMITARERLREVLNMEPNHPGLLHYLIHAYDVVKVDVAEQAREYALLYGKIVLTASHAQHMPAHIWMRTGSWNLASTADGNCIRVGLELCARKLLNENISISSIDLNAIFSVINTTQIPLLLKCDAENRAHSFEWLSYTRLQIGNWLGVLPLLRDLFIADKLSLIRPNYYLSAAYRTQARTIIELFFWFYNDNRFSDKVQQILALNGTQTIVSIGDNMTEYYPMRGVKLVFDSVNVFDYY